MSQNAFQGKRSPFELFSFAVTFYGIVTVAAGLVTTTPCAAALGFVMVGFGLLFFVARQLGS